VVHADADVLVFVRTLASPGAAEHILIAVNKAHAAKSVAVPTDATVLEGIQHASVLLGNSANFLLAPHSITLQLAPESAIMLDTRQ